MSESDPSPQPIHADVIDKGVVVYFDDGKDFLFPVILLQKVLKSGTRAVGTGRGLNEMFRRNDIVTVRSTGELGRVLEMAHGDNVIVEFSRSGREVSIFAAHELDLSEARGTYL